MKSQTRNPKHSPRLWLPILLLGAATAWIIAECWPPSQRTLAKAAAVVRRSTTYELRSGSRTLLTLATDSAYSTACWVNRWALIPSCGGRLITAAAGGRDTLSTLTDEQIHRMVRKQARETDSLIRGKNMELAEARYYLRVHGVQDEGYDMIAKLAQQLKRELEAMRATAEKLHRADSLQHLRIAKTVTYTVSYQAGEGQVAISACTISKVSSQRMILRTVDRKLPEGAKAVSVFPWKMPIPDHIYIARYGEDGYQAVRRQGVTRRLPIRRDCITDTLDGQGTIVRGKLCYKGGLKAGRYDGYGILTAADSIIYRGQWKAGKRQGVGYITDAQGRRIRGMFTADTLYYAARHDSAGVYEGQTNRLGIAEGHGLYRYANGRYYEGKWQDDRRDGFGFDIAPFSVLRAGEWHNDRYRGERMVYTSERIYGIDISKYQHEKGRRKYPIRWDRLRITHLGTLSRKRISGTVSYPVSFVYIKSTEGSTVRNRYYAGDYRQARSRGIHVGAYHFFSTTSPAATQARHFIRNTHFQKGDLPPVLDLEPFPSQIAKMGGTAVMWSRVRTWLNIVRAHTGVRPVLYVSQTFVNRYLPEAPDIKKKYPVWIARYGEYKPDVKLVYWQLSPDGRVEGIRSTVDINVFNGYQNVFNEYIKHSTIR